MYKTKIQNENPMLINSAKLREMLGCGRYSAEKIGKEAKAKIKVGKLVLWNVEKVKNYLDSIATD